MAKTTVILNTTARMIGIGAGPAKKGEAESHPMIKLPPGATPVDSTHWAAAKTNKSVAAMLKRGELEEGDEVDGDGESLADIKPAAAIKLVKACLDMKRLRAWLAEETRPPVAAVIQGQIDMIDAKAKKPESEGAAGG